MSLYVKQAPVGVDIPIQQLQTYLYPKLKKLWSLDDNTYNSYGRAYKNQTADGLIPEVYTTGNEYKEVFFDDTLTVLSFFSTADAGKYATGNSTIDASLTFMVDINKARADIIHRADEEVRRDVIQYLLSGKYGFEMTGFSTGIDMVFKEYAGWRKTQGIKYRDMQPLHCFRIEFFLLYPQDLTS